jgi:putative transcriptional regulator
MRRDGTLVRVKEDGVEETLPAAPLTRRTEAEIEAAALADPDAQPLTGADLKRMRRVPRAKTLRRALSLTQEEFALRYQIPLGTLRDWEQGRAEPDQPARAYLKVIAGDPHRMASRLASRSSIPPGLNIIRLFDPSRRRHNRAIAKRQERIPTCLAQCVSVRPPSERTVAGNPTGATGRKSASVGLTSRTGRTGSQEYETKI